MYTCVYMNAMHIHIIQGFIQDSLVKKFVGHCYSVMHEFAITCNHRLYKIFWGGIEAGGTIPDPLCVKP